MIQEIDGQSGDWGPELWPDASATVQPNGSQVNANSVLTQSTTARGQDPWTGWLQAVGGKVVDVWAGVQAKANGLTPAVAPNGQPTYIATTANTARPGTLSPGGLLLIGVCVVGGMLLARK